MHIAAMILPNAAMP